VRTPLPIAASIAQRPGYGGHAWAFLQYALGLEQLGYRPILIDRLTAEMATDASGLPSEGARRAGIEWFRAVVEGAGLAESSCLLLDDGETLGLGREDLRSAIGSAPFLLNVMGFLEDPDLLGAAPMRVFLDVDPGFPQLWRQLGLADLFAGHERYASVGANLGKPGCEIPDCGLEWIPLRPPVALDRWPRVAPASREFRSIGSWRGPFGPIEYGGRSLGLRVHEFRKYAALPRLVAGELGIALDIDVADRGDLELVRGNGWNLFEPRAVAGTLAAYREFVQASGAEIGIAKNIYVELDSGWFSDRSACFLASGRPVLAQDTGFGRSLPTGEGLLAFASLEEACAGVEAIRGDWSGHARAARELAVELFDAKKVLGGLLGALGAA
jgi:hypothetical protein